MTFRCQLGHYEQDVYLLDDNSSSVIVIGRWSMEHKQRVYQLLDTLLKLENITFRDLLYLFTDTELVNDFLLSAHSVQLYYLADKCNLLSQDLLLMPFRNSRPDMSAFCLAGDIFKARRPKHVHHPFSRLFMNDPLAAFRILAYQQQLERRIYELLIIPTKLQVLS
ncbi:unnamed protein product [Albugo candida]|uniref:Uncharacterized protein n=1 Tax=Albugo candida TaxID=65357 RepID=A0A024FST5_9STRA|nr:unnamed protein product [Albugo candida]|eukprot:CCI10075.1 unnamed protein product [Albugo candida]